MLLIAMNLLKQLVLLVLYLFLTISDILNYNLDYLIN